VEFGKDLFRFQVESLSFHRVVKWLERMELEVESLVVAQWEEVSELVVVVQAGCIDMVV